MQIKVENLSYYYGKQTKSLSVKALDNVSLTIEDGEIFGIIGRTGSGKSTFVQHLNGLIKIQKDSGKITVGEFDLSEKKCDFKSLRKNIGMVFQYPEYQLFAETIKDDIAFALKNFSPELKEDEVEARVKEAAELVGIEYERVKEKSPFDLSGGQRRRIAIAGVIVSRPSILVLDEPVAGLDPKGKRELVDLIKRLKEKFVKTIVIVSHDMDLVADFCDRVAVFDGGKIYKVGTPEEIFNSQEEMEKLGLELPQTGWILANMKANGVSFDAPLDEQGFTKKLLEKYCGGGEK